VVKTNPALLHCHSLPSALIETEWGAAIASKTTTQDSETAVAAKRALRIHTEFIMAVAPFWC
jgi:hypothetical protein